MSQYQPQGQYQQPMGTPQPGTAPEGPGGAQPQHGYPSHGGQPQDQGYFAQQGQSQMGGEGNLNSQMSNMGLGPDGYASARGKKKGRHAYHDVNQANQFSAAPATSSTQFGGQMGPGASPHGGFAAQQWSGGTPGANGQLPSTPGMVPSQMPARTGTPLHGSPVTSAQGKVDAESVPSIPWSRDGPSQYYLDNIYPTMEQHLPPPASVPFVAVDQSNSSPKYARLTLNNIPASHDALASTSIPLGLILQPLAPRQDGEQEVPVIDFGDTGPPRCRRCRAYVNPFMPFRSGGNRFVCNMCTFPNDTPPEYFAPTDPSGARVDRLQRPELSLGTVEFVAPREYWTKEPVPQRWLFLIDVSQEAVSKSFLKAFSDAIVDALYPNTDEQQQSDRDDSLPSLGSLAPGSRVGFATFDREVHFYSFRKGSEQPQMVVMPDAEEPFVPISDGLFVDPSECKTAILSLLRSLPRMFGQIKQAEPALLPALNAAMDALHTTGGRTVCSLSSLPTWGPGRLFLRDKPELRDTDNERKGFVNEHPNYHKCAKGMTEHGIGVDFFLAAPQGGYLDLATIGHIAEKTGGEMYYFPNFQYPRDTLKLSKEIAHALKRDSGFQALLKVRCSNGLQVDNYFGNFTQHNFGADVELGAIDADRAFGVSFTYDGRLDPKLDAHFQSALLYTTASGQRRIRCTNTVASVSEGALESMKLVDQDAVICLLAKQATAQMPDRQLKDIRARLTERTIDILAGYRKNFSGSHPPGQLVLPEHLKEFAMYMLALLKSRALKAGIEPTDRRVHDMRLVKGMSPGELSVYLYPRMIALHALDPADGFPNERGHLRMPQTVRASYSRVDEGGAYLLDLGPSGPLILWLHSQVSPNLLEDLFGPNKTALNDLDPYSAALPVLETHLNAQTRNILQFLEDHRGSRGVAVQIARQGLDGAEYEFARSLVEDRNNEAMSYVDWLVHVHRHVQLELQGQRKKDDLGSGIMDSLSGLKNPLW